MTGRVQDKVALVTGGAGGLGASIVRLLAREGAKVTVADVTEASGKALAAEVGGDFVKLDVSSETDWAAAIAAVDAKHGRIDVLVNGAGIEGEISATSPETTSLAEWRGVQAVNLDGVFLGCRAVLPAMKREGKGSIVNLSSIVAYFGTPHNMAYGASKAGVLQLSKTIALYGSRDGNRIRCNSVHPGIIKTRMVDSIFDSFSKIFDTTTDGVEQSALRGVPLGMLGEPDDVGYLVLYLASDESRYVTGSEFMVDGGWHMVDAR